jgi:formate-dependent nitrite reductase membrane component NrfD
MSWGSWVLLVVYGVLLVSALIRLPDAWPWLAARVPALQRASDWMLARPGLIRMLAWVNVVLGVLLGVYTGILLNTMVARPLWNTTVLPVLFLVSGLSAAAAMMHLATRIFPGRPAPKGLVGGAFAAMVQNLGPQPPEKRTVDSLVRADIGFLVAELLLIGILVVGLLSSTASHAQASTLLLGGPYTLVFWGGVVAVGIVVPLVLQWLELGHRIPHTILPAALVLAGGFALRWVMVNAGQASQIVQSAGLQ